MFKYDKYDNATRHVITTAMNEARSRNHARYSLEHVLLGLVAPDSPVSALMQQYGLTRADIALQMDRRNPRRSVQAGNGTQPTAYVEDIFADVQQRIERAGRQHANCLHLLYSTIIILRLDESIAAKICDDLHVDLNALLSDVVTSIESEIEEERTAKRRAQHEKLMEAITSNDKDVDTLAFTVVQVVNDKQYSEILDRLKK